MNDDALVDLRIDRIALGGEGVGRSESGQVVFVPRTAPGDRLRVRLTQRRARWARGLAVELKEAGPARVVPPCPYYAGCGGCQMLHLARDTQRVELTREVAEVLRRVGGTDVPVEPMVSTTAGTGYRNRVTFTLRRVAARRVVAGYHAPRGPGLVEVEHCLLAEPAVARAWQGLREAWGEGARRLPPGGEIRITLRAAASGIVALLVTGDQGPGSIAEGRALAADVPGLASYWWAPARGSGGPIHLAGAETLPDRWGGIDLGLRPRVFLQVHREASRRIEAHLDAGLDIRPGSRLVDLYAGVGLRAIRWALRGASVRSVEADPDAVATGREAARRAGARPDLRLDTVEAALEDIGPADAIVVNPPRTGLGRRAAALLRKARADRLVYVSCEPATLARDVRRLAEAWRPLSARPFDAFPHTGHIETVLWMEPRRGSREGGDDA